ncbi:MAG: hypothetical protein FJW86_02940 [Actinobacteria bacterium]|nr:hypothetical protein [Actinomycetota bacterium]
MDTQRSGPDKWDKGDGMTAPAAPTTPTANERIELTIALDMAKRAAFVAPVLMVGVGIWRGWDAVAAVALAIGVVVLNWIVAAVSLGWAARHTPNMLLGVALFGFIARLALITGIGVGIKELDIVDWPVFCGALLLAYAGLLVWELRYVSFSLASPGLKPKRPTKVGAS